MEQAPFYRTDLHGRKIPVSYAELHPILRDIVHYFEVNLYEPQNVLLLDEYSKLEYWKYLSISWNVPESAESKRYAWLCERGCLALLNGLSLDFLTQQQSVGSHDWQKIKALAPETLQFLKLYQPSDSGIEAGREFLLASYTFIVEVSSEDVDEDGNLGFPTQAQGAWFTRNIVGEYYRSTATLDFG